MKKGFPKNHSAAYKAKIATEAAHGARTTADLGQAYSVHPSQITAWKRHLLSNVQELFERGSVAKANRAHERLRDELYQESGGLEAIYAKPKTSKPAPSHRPYPYILRCIRIHPSQHGRQGASNR